MPDVRLAILTKNIFSSFLFGGYLLFLPNVVQSATSDSATLQWAANIEPDLAGYRIYHGTAPGVYGAFQAIGKTTTYQYTNLEPSKTHYFTITAFDTVGNESLPSTEVSKTIAGSNSQTAPSPTMTSNTTTLDVLPVGIRTAWTAAAQIPGGGWVDSNFDNRTFRILFKGSAITASGSPVQVTFRGRTSGNYTVQNVKLVQRDGTTLNGVDSTFQAVTFNGGASSVTVPAGGTVTSDPIAFTLGAGQDVFLTFWAPPGTAGVYRDGGISITTWFITGADQTSKIDWGSLTISDTRPIIYNVELVTVGASNTQTAPSTSTASNSQTAPNTSVALNGQTEPSTHKANSNPTTASTKVVWRNTSSGEVAVWLMNGLTLTSVGFPGGTSTDWKIEQVGDLNGDGQADVLWRNTINGVVAIWLMNEATIISSGFLGGVPAEWVIKGIGDVNGDEKADVVWQNSASGAVAVWLMNGLTLTSVGFPGSTSTDWDIRSVGDVNGDGKADVVWQNPTSGAVAVWLMNGLTITSLGFLPSTSTDWDIRSVGDMNGDGKVDVLWRNSSNGEVAVWLMNGTTIASYALLGGVPFEWEIKQVSDTNGDGKADVVWQNQAGGRVAVWLMNGLSINSVGFPGSTPANWKIQR